MNQNQTCRRCGSSIPVEISEEWCADCLKEPVTDDDETISTRRASSGPGRSGRKVSPFAKGRKSNGSETPKDELMGTMIGPYKLYDCLGEGGMGRVYAAEQRSPIRRKVAIKLIKPGMDSREVLARFDAERHALALMDHPNIARVLDGGVMDNGRPYFVMDLVMGLPVTDYCDKNRLSIGDRLELFHQICLGIQHAHQKGIIHRDIKPSNVVVALNHGQPIPKVIDFGIAKAMGAELTQKTYFTFTGQIVGTPQYMSPEQAESHPTDIDTRSDIYSLGVLLYELLTGQTPISNERFLGVGLEEMLRLIREHDPVKPSTLLSRLNPETVSALTGNRSTASGKLAQLLRGDLDWLVMKALEKDRSRRYETANSLALDVRNFLRNEPITATPPTLRYRMGKFARRHRGPIAAILTVAFVLVGGLVASLWQAARANEEASRARAAEEIALANLKTADEQRRIAFEERGKARKAQEFAELSRKKAENALSDAEAAQKRAETALTELRVSKQREAEGEIRRSDLEGRVTELLSFLRSEEMRQAFQKRHPDGLGIVRSIDETITRVFPGTIRAADFIEQDYRMSLKLGANAVHSLDSSLSTAHRNFQSAFDLFQSLRLATDPPDIIELATIQLQLGRIERMRGNYAAAQDRLNEAHESARQAGERVDASALRVAILLENAEMAAHLRLNRSSELIRIALDEAERLPENSPDYLVSRMTAASLLLDTTDDLPAGFTSALGEILSRAENGANTSAEEKLAAAQAEVMVEMKVSHDALALPAPTAGTTESDGTGSATEPQISLESVSGLIKAVDRIREVASTSNDRRFKSLELATELRAASFLAESGLRYEALQHFQRCLDRSRTLLQLDAEIADPLEVQYKVGLAMAAIYGEAGEHAKRLASLENAYDGLLEARRRGLDTGHYESEDPAFFQNLVEASIHQFYVSSGSPSALEENAFFADEVNYFGKEKKERRFILDDQQRYRERYPQRLFKVREIVEISGTESEGFNTHVIIDYWLADPKKSNNIRVDRPDGELGKKIRFAFDNSNRLKIVSIAIAEKEQGLKTEQPTGVP